MKMCEKLQDYRGHLQSMQRFCERMHQERAVYSSSNYWAHCLMVWTLAEQNLYDFFKKEDFQDEQTAN